MTQTSTSPHAAADKAAASITVDAAVFHQDKNGFLWVLAIERTQPKAGQLALPGTFCNAGEEPSDAIARALVTKTGLPAGDMRLVGTYGSPGPDPWNTALKLIYAGEVSEMRDLTPVISRPRWITADEFVHGDPAFEHAVLLGRARDALGLGL